MSAARYIIRKNGAPYQTFTRITEKRAQEVTPSQGIGSMPNLARIQFKALYEGSNSQNQAMVLIAVGITHGTSSMPRSNHCCARSASKRTSAASEDSDVVSPPSAASIAAAPAGADPEITPKRRRSSAGR